jgi:carbonic anhydrase
MEKLFSCECSKGHYNSQACIVWCFDDRFSNVLNEFTNKCGIKDYDLVKIAGGAKCLASPQNASEREFVLNQIQTSIKLHGTKKIILMNHADCGAYGGSKSFSNDDSAERMAHKEELKKAELFLKENLPGDIEIEKVFAGFNEVCRA